MIMCYMIVFLWSLGWLFPMFPTLVGSELCFDFGCWSLDRCMLSGGTYSRGRVACSLPCIFDFMARWVFPSALKVPCGRPCVWWHLFSSGWPILVLAWWFQNVGVIWLDLWRSRWVIPYVWFWFCSWCVLVSILGLQASKSKPNLWGGWCSASHICLM